MEILIKAPSVNKITIDKLSANYINISWDDVGRNFYYLVEMKNVTQNGEWVLVDTLKDPKLTISTLNSETDYQIRVIVSSRGFSQSEPTYTDVFKTFIYNLYTFDVMNELTLSDTFIDEKFTNNNIKYIDFNNDAIYASLMQRGFIYNPVIKNVSNISDKILRKREYHNLTSSVETICTDKDNIMVGYIDDVLYMVERFQMIAKTSNDMGQTWQTVELFDNRIGNPISDTIFCQNKTTSYALGYDQIFYGRPTNKIRWSSITERFSQIDVSFTTLDRDVSLGYEIELFSRYIILPNDLNKGKVEAFSTTDETIYVAGNGVLRYHNFIDMLFDDEPTSPNYGGRIFDEDNVIKLPHEKVVVKKMDVMDGKLYLLITGKLKEGKINKHNVNNIDPSEYDGVYTLNETKDGLIRIFGNTLEERNDIEHRYTNMSTNGKELFINYAKYNRNEYYDEDVIGEDGNLYISNRQVLSNGYLNDVKPLQGSWRLSYLKGSKWERGFMKYYNESQFTYMARQGNRSFITSERQIGIVHAEMQYTKMVEIEGYDSDRRIMKEVWENGDVEIYVPDIKFRDFTTYSSGILLYKSSGEIIGYFEFSVDVINEVDVIWKPKNLLLRASLVGQTREEVVEESQLNRLDDPNLVPFIKKIIPENYFRDSDIENSRYYEFIKLYLEYLSESNDSTYKTLLNLTRNKDPMEPQSLDYLWSEMYKRNIYIDEKKRDETIRFFLSREHDFYSAKGTIQSYKFLFKLLYNEDVEIDDETTVMNYYITADMESIDSNIIGQTIFTNTGRCQVSNIERIFVDGKMQWNLSVINVIGEMQTGQVLRSESSRYNGVVTNDLVGKELLYNDIDYISRGRSYYIMRIKSKLPMSRYKNDVMRFVHPIGIGFIGIVDLTLFMNAGLHLRHLTTEINLYKTLRFDAGIPTHHPDTILQFDSFGNVVYDRETGYPLTKESPLNNVEIEIDVDEYNKENVYKSSNTVSKEMNEFLLKSTPNERRKRFNPLFDSSGSTFAQFRDMTKAFIEDSYKYRLIDNIDRPRDSEESTQRKLEEDINEKSTSLL